MPVTRSRCRIGTRTPTPTTPLTVTADVEAVVIAKTCGMTARMLTALTPTARMQIDRMLISLAQTGRK